MFGGSQTSPQKSRLLKNDLGLWQHHEVRGVNIVFTGERLKSTERAIQFVAVALVFKIGRVDDSNLCMATM